MTTPTVPAEGDLGFSYELQIDIDLDAASQTPTGVPDWYQLSFITNVQPGNDKTFQDSATYRNRGAAAQAITGESWQLAFDHQIQRLPNGLYIPTLDALVQASKFGKRNKAAQVHLRWYDWEGADWAFEGTGYVAMARTNAGNADLGVLGFTITGDGAATEITNPFAQPLPTTPFITSALPSGQGTGDMVAIRGARFTGATLVEFGGVAAVAITVVDDGLIMAELDTDSAGPAPIEVTTPAGTNATPFPYTRAS